MREEGYEDGINDKAIEVAENLLKLGVNTPEQISQTTDLPLEQVLKNKEKFSVTV